MASRRIKVMFLATAGVLGASTWFIYSIMAAQGQGSLAQAPLNNQVQVPPAFIMAVDNSGSMSTDETLFRTATGPGYFRNGSFFDSSGNLWESGSGRTTILRHMDGGYYSDTYGALRSPEYNRAYFNPTVTYLPWRTSAGALEANSNPKAAVEDPRGPGHGAALPLTTFDFTTYLQATETWPAGSIMPKGTTYNNDRNCNRAPGSNKNQGWITLTQDMEFSSNCSTTFRYYPARVYLSDSAPPPPGFNLSKRVKVKGIGPKATDLWRYDYIESNFSSGGAEAVQNFANWWTYSGNRNRAMISAMTQSMSTVNNLRVGYFKINPPTLPGNDVVMRDLSVQSDKDALYKDMRALDASGNTPTRRAVAKLVKQFMRKDSGAPIQLQCQKNAGMLFTDGYTNDDNGGLSGYLNVGNTDGGQPAPYGGGVSSSNTIADYAMYGYNTNLRPDLPAGNVPVPSSCGTDKELPGTDCNSNLHMNFYGITLGARGAIYDVNAASTEDPYSNPPAWGATGTMSLKPENVDDIWHASLNSRGEFINANSPDDIVEAMRRVLSAVSAGASPSGSLALTGSRISTRTLDVQPSYEIRNEGTDWFSKLRAMKLSIDSETWGVKEEQIWEASDRLAGMSYSTRIAHTWFGTATGAKPFTSANITLADLCSNPRPGMSRCTEGKLTSLLSVTAAQAVNYLMGYTQSEVRNGGKLRDRTTLLGDIINSTPIVSAPTDDYGYRSLGTVGSVNYGESYNEYMETKRSDRSAMVYVGANDGMLHAFNGGLDAEGNVDSANGGREVFAYIPRSVLGHMGNLLFPYLADDKNDQKFSHRYFVDGPIAVSDAYYGGGWKTILVGTTGAGGRSVFALDVSNPGGFDANSRLWEIDDQNADASVAANIGHVLGKPVIVPVRESGAVSWKAIFGNGYNSQDGKAVLFVVDVSTGGVRMIEAIEPGAPAGTNGLGNIAVVDRWAPPVGNPTGGLTRNARDGFADTVYAADQKGAIWRFDLRDSTGLISTPLFTTQVHAEDGDDYRQPITGGLSVTAGRGGGVMILFGTGSFSFTGDSADESVQTIYGVLDSGFSGTRTPADLAGRSSTTSVDGRTRIVTGGANSAAGWFLDLPAGERAVGYPRVASGVLFIPTYAPAVVDGCSTSGLNWLYGLNTRTGAAALSSVRFGSTLGDTQGPGVGAVALDTLGTAPVKDVGITVLSRAAPPNPGEAPPPDDGCWMRITVPGMEEEMFVPYPCGRQSWRQLQ